MHFFGNLHPGLLGGLRARASLPSWFFLLTLIVHHNRWFAVAEFIATISAFRI